MSEFERANLISWARQLALNGKLLVLVDPSILSLDGEQALLCITIALLCLQRSPAKRPTLKEIVGMLSGGAEPPHLPFEFSPSPAIQFLLQVPEKGSRTQNGENWEGQRRRGKCESGHAAASSSSNGTIEKLPDGLTETMVVAAEPNIVVIMAGDQSPTYLATPVPVPSTRYSEQV
ncbi:hypothetical protein F0562_025070 [Nyssa sinensis]|uniref:Uncharacterized protein n=1 Tax=Nyssa sinensis TaxID=561372 RepID=A0A5J5BH70_9ASTE|nr:hypothetical protein F0562_025070 [Nyssa sinensis]